MFPIRISQDQVCSLKRKFWGCFVQLDYCNLAFFSSHCIPEQPLSHTVYHCLLTWATLPSTWLYWNMYYSKNIPPSQWSRSTRKWDFPTLFVPWPVFVLSANTLRCWNSSTDGVFLLLFSGKIGRWEINSSFWSRLEGIQEQHVIRAASAPQSAPLATPPSCATFLAYRVFLAEQVPWWSSPRELVHPSSPWTAWKPAEW